MLCSGVDKEEMPLATYGRQESCPSLPKVMGAGELDLNLTWAAQ